uniref:DDE-1 domain-containing protein n=1 Tax=Glossina palpalis gambiensis TaxID=67801 RepID=A0A1B0BVG0_9MUSC
MKAALSLWIEDRNQKRVPLRDKMVKQSLHNIKIFGEGESADIFAVERYPEEFASLVADGGYKPEQTKLHCFGRECQTKHSFLKAKSAPGFKAAKDRVTLVLCSNASGDCVIKPLMVYRSFNPRALQNQNKNNLPVFWRANTEAWVTSAIFFD